MRPPSPRFGRICDLAIVAAAPHYVDNLWIKCTRIVVVQEEHGTGEVVGGADEWGGAAG